jgi:hypothetical protein
LAIAVTEGVAGLCASRVIAARVDPVRPHNLCRVVVIVCGDRRMPLRIIASRIFVLTAIVLTAVVLNVVGDAVRIDNAVVGRAWPRHRRSSAVPRKVPALLPGNLVGTWLTFR